MPEDTYADWAPERLIRRIVELEEERAVLYALVDAARAVDADRGAEGPQLLHMRRAIEAVDCHNIG